MIPYGRQTISNEDIEAVINVLKSDYLTQGPAVPTFEQAVCHSVNSQYAVAVNSGTSALHIACLALELGEDDWLWTSPNTFVASANCGLYCGAKVDFVDIDSQSYNLCAKKLEKKLIEAKANNRLPKIVIPVHFAGQSCDMKRIYELSQKYGFRIIEDASHAIGGEYKKQPVGNCQYSDITVFSFHPVKIITTGEGGMATTNSKNLARRMEMLRSHGITREQSEMSKEPDGDWYYQQSMLGFNYRMTDIQAALGCSQMAKLKEFINDRHALARRYVEQLAQLPVVIPLQNSDSISSYHLYPILLKLDEVTKTKRQIFSELRSKGVGVNVHYIPVHTQPYYQSLGFKLGDYPEAEAYYNSVITIPLFSGMTHQQQDYVVEQIKQVVRLG
ncbi:MAG: UDP-4-amino-4,6-dideoxy-N-acetyl-beta-L-altrosamine transaminase [Methylophaga sp.]|nr:MAG: UDP-4-amino-4,6-dideoxy-N-acetyl-beta-L-altrosamine transaminase [Methylophaga sp.]